MKTVYKIFKVTDKGLESIFNYTGYSLVYNKDEWNYPKLKNSKLFAFSTKRYVKSFFDELQINLESHLTIYKCRTPDFFKIDTVATFIESVDILRFWRDESFFQHGYPPTGTVGCDKIKLIEEIKL